MKVSGFAPAVAFEILCGNQVRDPNVYAGTMGRYTSGPLGDCTDLVHLHPIAILIQFYDKLGGGWRRGKKVVAVIFGERSTARLYKRMAKVVDEGFAKLNWTSF